MDVVLTAIGAIAISVYLKFHILPTIHSSLLYRRSLPFRKSSHGRQFRPSVPHTHQCRQFRPSFPHTHQCRRSQRFRKSTAAYHQSVAYHQLAALAVNSLLPVIAPPSLERCKFLLAIVEVVLEELCLSGIILQMTAVLTSDMLSLERH
uniref:Uncharacterized protein n=1 Tax=Parascaris univalens TaxID=6257 RepID=A0A914ZNS2_PARUN